MIGLLCFVLAIRAIFVRSRFGTLKLRLSFSWTEKSNCMVRVKAFEAGDHAPERFKSRRIFAAGGDMLPVISSRKFQFVLLFSILSLFTAVNAAPAKNQSSETAGSSASCSRLVKADIVALEQPYLLNRFAAYVPAGMLFALRSDVVSLDGDGAPLTPGRVKLRSNKRPRPLVLRVNEGDCLDVTFTNLLDEVQVPEGGIPRENDGRLPGHVGGLPASPGRPVNAQKTSMDLPRTRAASFHIAGLSTVEMRPDQCPRDVVCGGDGSNVGLSGLQGTVFNAATPADVRGQYDLGSMARPGRTVVTRWFAKTEGAYFAYSSAAPVGGEGDGGQIGLGLFAAVNVEPKGSRWYRSQVTYDEIGLVKGTTTAAQHPYRAINYDREVMVNGRSRPVLGMLDSNNNLVHSDLNAIVVLDDRKAGPGSLACNGTAFGSSCGRPFREFTVIFHDEVHAQQAFSELEDENNPLSLIRDGMGINYGVSSMGALMMGTPQYHKTGPAKNCPECRAEEFFLSSWANGDPALLLSYDADGVATGARYPDDPSNVHHSYLGDPVRFRNIHAGPKETHVFHLHAHQWLQDGSNPLASYLDSQTISPGATFSYNIEFGGSGNRNYTPGDSIFHCHLYPHFAQGMWELWRTHDAFVDGKPGLFNPDKPVGPDNDPQSMNLPDGEIASGTAQPALIPIPGLSLAPMPTAAFRGYPFYVPGTPGHRPPQPVLDMDVNDATWVDMSQEPAQSSIVDGGLPRHVVTDGTLTSHPDRSLEKGGAAAQVIAQRVAKQDPAALALAKDWGTLTIKPLKHSGEPDERNAMRFHEGSLAAPGLNPVAVSATDRPHSSWWSDDRAYLTDRAATTAIQKPVNSKPLFFVNGGKRAPGAPYANPCPVDAPMRDYRVAFVQTELTYNKHGWFDPQGRIMILENDVKDVIDPNKRTRLPEPLFFRANSGECINFKSSNFVPSALNADDFQIYTPTDTIGQHIHLVKFDVTSSDGSANGFNYEDATFSPDEVRERIFAWNRSHPEAKLQPKTHPLFMPNGAFFEAAGGLESDERYGDLLKRGRCPEQGADTDEAYEERLRRDHPFCGAQRTTQRWWADPILTSGTGKDQTLRTVFTHDHLGPSSHQQHGLYAGLVIEPANSVWTRVSARLSSDDMVAAKDADTLNCSLPVGNAGRSPLCDKLIGGSNLTLKTAQSLLKPANPILGAIEPRPPLKLRPDGGPTATMANIIAPTCAGDSDSNVLQPDVGLNRLRKSCSPQQASRDTRREFALAIADFGIAYNMALEPINPEPRGDSVLRDNSMVRFGRRHVANTPARPLGISSEDPGSQYFNYRHEPLALRLSETKVDEGLGGWDYRQARLRANMSSTVRRAIKIVWAILRTGSVQPCMPNATKHWRSSPWRLRFSPPRTNYWRGRRLQPNYPVFSATLKHGDAPSTACSIRRN